LGFDRLGEPEQRLPVRDLELHVAFFELLRALFHDRVEQRLAALELLLLERQLAYELALALDQPDELDAFTDEPDEPAALARPRDEPDDRAFRRRPVIELDRVLGVRDDRDAERFGSVRDRALEERDALERARDVVRDDDVKRTLANLVVRLDDRA